MTDLDTSSQRRDASPLRRRSRRRATLVAAVVLVAALGVSVAVAGWLVLRASLPQLDGTWHATRAAALAAPVTIERDALGVPTITGRNRGDVAYATGFVQAQDRFFQMDLLRRVAAGEMSALVGPAALDLDRRNRLHRFREHARRLVEAAPRAERELIDRYTAGVNDGLSALASRPPEYWLLGTRPAAWRPEDTALVVYAMYLDLQMQEARRILARAALRERVPPGLFAFLLPGTSQWDAPFDAASAPTPAADFLAASAVPSTRPEWLSSAQTSQAVQPSTARALAALDDPLVTESGAVGSNGWVVDGAHSAASTHGGAILASDMHLGLSLPNIWYRVALQWPDANGAQDANRANSEKGVLHRVVGVSLPGAPLVIAGSNGYVAWGFTNSYGRFIDLIDLERDPADPLRYRVPGGWARATVVHERIDVKGGAPVDLPVIETRWGPEWVVGTHAYALRWVAHDREAVNLHLQALEDAHNVADALHVAQTSGIPTQNIMVADAHGSIGWTLAGPLPRHEASSAASDAAASDLPFKSSTYAGWQGYLPPDAYPARIDPPLGRLWTANNRALPLDEQRRIGDAGADPGARAAQIRDDLLALPHAAERDLLAIQTDDRARWIEPWRRVALDVLDADALKGHPQRAAFRRQLEQWNGRADADAVGYRLVRGFFFSMYDGWFGKLDASLAASFADSLPGLAPQAGYRMASSRYAPVMETLAANRAWVPDGETNWRAFVLDRIDHAIGELPKGTTVDNARWGERNRASIEHPFARLVPAWLPWVRGALGAPRDPLPGDINMPRVQAQSFGASERMIVSPGREQDGIFEMPGGQSGHPLSPYFLAGHEAWVRGDAVPFLPGEMVHRLVLTAP
ncbi:penicillin acylase family protein [Paraburkholderia kururiensis]|uniref:penicillin acylase family protein n=1 Tax=Paraburkholderia kururiensis TaxID=984307 RepID=UPI000693604B|nr:penicillin acylase family protein [Paraburkholderia kururiensis]